MGFDPLTTGLIGAGISGITGLVSGKPGTAASNNAGANYADISAAARKLLGDSTFQKALNPQELSGYGAALPQLTNIYASLMGLPEPGGMTTNFGGTAPDVNPYSLDYHQQGMLNKSQDEVNAARQREKNDVMQGMVSSGLTDPSLSRAALQQIDAKYDTVAQQQKFAAEQQAAETKRSGITDLVTMVSGLYGAQQGEQGKALQQILAATGMLGSAASGYQGQVQNAQAGETNVGGDLGALAAMIAALGNKKSNKAAGLGTGQPYLGGTLTTPQYES